MDKGSPIKQMVAANLATLDPACDGPPKPVLAKPFDLRSSIGARSSPWPVLSRER